MEWVITASEANQRFSELLQAVADGQRFTVVSGGRPVACVLPVECPRENRSVGRLLKFLDNLPVRHLDDWSRIDLYE